MNKELKTKEYIQKLENLKLSESSQSRMENSLLEYARFHSVRVEGDGRSIKQVPQSTSLFNLFKPTKPMTAFLIAIALMAGGGTSYAAEGAVPGEFLYTVKTEVNENVKSAFAVSNEAEASLQARLAEERLHEAEELAVRGELTAEVSADINSRLKTHYDEAEERNVASEAKGDYESSATVRASLEGSFRAYADVLTDLNARVSGNDGTSLITNIRTYAEITAKSQTQATSTIEASVDVKSLAENTIKRGDKFIAEIETKLVQAEGGLSAEAYAQAEAKLAGAVSAQVEAKTSFQNEAYTAAYSSAQTSIRIASEVEIMIRSMLRLNVDMGVGATINGVLDIQSGSNTRTETEANNQTNTKSESGADTDQKGSPDSSVDIKLETKTEATLETDIVDVRSKTDATVSSGLNL